MGRIRDVACISSRSPGGGTRSEVYRLHSILLPDVNLSRLHFSWHHLCMSIKRSLRLLDLSAAFDTIDHNILITRLSSFWYPWLCSQLVQDLLIIFRVNCDNNLSFTYTSSCGVPQALFLVHYFWSRTLPSITHISSLPFTTTFMQMTFFFWFKHF